MGLTKREQRAEAIERLRNLTYDTSDDIVYAALGWDHGPHSLVSLWVALINLLIEDDWCEMELTFDMSAIRCSRCFYRLPNGTNPSDIRYCPSCGAKVRTANDQD